MRLQLKIRMMIMTVFFLGLLSPIQVSFAHGGNIEVSEGGTKGPVHLTPEQARMLDIKVVQATHRPMAQLLGLNGQIQLLPDAQADVSIRISGSVTAIDVNLGDSVKAGQRLATVQSRLVGNPPPSVAVNASIAGIIDARNINLGQAVEPNTVLFHISNRDKLLVIAQVYEEDLGKVKVGQEVNIHALSYPKQTFPGQVTLIEPNLDPMTRTVNLRITLDNKEGLLKPGMFVRANVILTHNKAALTVPNAALLQADNQQFVFVQNGDTYKRVNVKVGAVEDDYSEITEGLVPGDLVVTQGNRELYTLWLSGGRKLQSGQEEHH
ncbi:TPA: efflux RND transporter periplasmic adaptor subunit [Legionella pneumophila subsp. pneumophila]|uniref:Chemiosmotic efflux system protein B-like protein n=1 Tax=Legionella pneumophila (strain Lens) TaxID=297245 RepID=Q5WUV3_LEGPL|nr:efflux RND transporter periplasmic adaptor subunit [Legionella pneumophila]AOW51404.1 efflux transporter periplasmic adaptor subunit [Legionella pneumophila subsp. pneumophila]AOW54997.1 efflux transporter periplasmic adaptor subunit [Legionella pneumophila subsp. pneumophila]AOW64911.1 efflux transporter periplasmic adaptor subunit [Legionella pneumophila subsp. pneumophila]RYW81462.1 efflux RND transporter periplasmic adaptor subunit [Legionella pneumophila]RYW86746.1 efflux RND transport